MTNNLIAPGATISYNPGASELRVIEGHYYVTDADNKPKLTNGKKEVQDFKVSLPR